MIELAIATYLMAGVTFATIVYAYNLTKMLNSDEYRQQVCIEVLKERRRKEGFS